MPIDRVLHVLVDNEHYRVQITKQNRKGRHFNPGGIGGDERYIHSNGFELCSSAYPQIEGLRRMYVRGGDHHEDCLWVAYYGREDTWAAFKRLLKEALTGYNTEGGEFWVEVP